jgi:uncharacterized protein (UPF0276 family)
MTIFLAPNATGAPAMPEPLGVGFGCHLALPDAIYTPDLLDFVEVTPEVFHREANVEGRVRLVANAKSFDAARRRCESLPIAMHGVSLSIGSAHGMYQPCLSMMDRLRGEWPFHWYSEHLHFLTMVDANGNVSNTGIPCPLPPTTEAAELVAGRAAFIQRRYSVPFLLENPVHYLPDLPADPEIGDEFGLMERIVELSGCGQLLDLHNLYCNAINFGFDPLMALDRIRLDHVREIHVAGGSWRDGFYMDAHDGFVPAAVWDLMEKTLSRAPRIIGVVFEILDEYLERAHPDGIARELEKARAIWRRHHPVAKAAE